MSANVQLPGISNISLPFRMRIVEALERIHDSGVKHADIAKQHILFDKGHDNLDSSVCIIDFDRAEEHRCKRAGDMIIPDDWIPLEADFNCPELYDIVSGLNIWTPSK